MSKTNYNEFGSEIIRLVGGPENVAKLTHCVTRLRFSLKDESVADTDELKKVKGVISVVQANNQYQVVVGGEVVPTFKAIMKKYNFGGQGTAEEPKDKGPLTAKKVFSGILDYISGTMVQIIPLFIGCGLISVILAVVQIFFEIDRNNSTYLVLYSVSNAVLYFLPGLVGFAAAKKLDCNPFLGAIIGLFLLHPSFTGMVGTEMETALFGIPFKAISYSSSVIPSLLGVWVLSKIEPVMYNILPKVLKSIFAPFLCILIMAPLMIFILGPVGNVIGVSIANAVIAMESLPLGLGCGILSMVQPLLVVMGAHTLLALPMTEMLGTLGYDAFVRPAFICAAFGSFGALLAVTLRVKNKEYKSVCAGATVAQFLGTAEPGAYGVLIPLMKPYLASLIGAFAGGMTSSVLGARAYAMGKNGVFGWLVFGDTIPQIVIASLAAAVIGFILCWILGFDESKVVSE